MDFEWDHDKAALNLRKHGVSFDDILEADWSQALVGRDSRADYGEIRFMAYVPIHKRLYVVIYTPRKSKRRIISLRKANPREARRYEKTSF